jgi:crotonobetainyl-CoA:carnitine CoA-transferase CaiB-like acyl-CoA transferase
VSPVQCLANLPFHFSDTDTTIRSVARSNGRHNREVAAGLGYAAGDVDAPLQDGVLYTP